MKRLKVFSVVTFTVMAMVVCAVMTNAQAQKTASDFTLQNLNGEEVNLRSFQGSQNVLLVFGTTWCPYCAKEIPDLNQLQAELGSSGLTILSVYVQEKKGKVTQFTADRDVAYEVLLDIEGDVARAYGVRGIPANYFIDKTGAVIYSSTGAVDVDKIKALAQA
ncbi:MAG: TlpA family protein disulfide reductase [Candidatus Omnitrophica bacterium]|nr:TlpA family protein disulfide reductase [Candidatus Omnitrophota bacterium]